MVREKVACRVQEKDLAMLSPFLFRFVHKIKEIVDKWSTQAGFLHKIREIVDKWAT
jgi:hypothetical protein